MSAVREALGSQWVYPSDHFPVGVTFGGDEKFSVISWNILNSLWVSYIDNDRDSQGLRQSKVVKWHQKKPDEWTKREHKVVDRIVSMLNDPSQNRVLCLQEGSKITLPLLQKKLYEAFGDRFSILTSDMKYNDLGIVIYDASKLELSQSKVVHGTYSDDTDNFILDMQFNSKTSPGRFRVVSTHIPGGAKSIGRKEFATYLKENSTPATPTIVVGDMNQTTETIGKAICKVLTEPTSLHALPVPYYTHVNTFREAADYDQIWHADNRGFEIAPMSLASLDPTADEVMKSVGFNKPLTA